MPGIAASDPEEEDIEFLTAVTADEKRGKRPSEEFDVKTISKKSKQDDGELETVSNTPAPPVTRNPSGLLSNKDVSVKAKGTPGKSESSKDKVSDKNVNEKVVSEAQKPSDSTEATSTTNPHAKKKKENLICDICKKPYLNYQGLAIHRSRIHKDAPPMGSPASFSLESQNNIKKLSVCQCGKTFFDEKKLMRHQRRNCQVHNVKSQSKASPPSIVTNAPVNESLEESEVTTDFDKEATVEERLAPDEGDGNENSESSEEEFNRRLFMDNVADGSDEEEDDDLEIIDFVAGSTHRLRNEGVKSEPVESESDSKMKLIQQSKYYQENSRMFELCPAENVSTFEKELKSLKGWKVKVNQIKKPNGSVVPATHFLSPEGITVRSGVAVLEYLRLGGWGQAEITAQARRMKVKESNLKVYQEKYFGAATD